MSHHPWLVLSDRIILSFLLGLASNCNLPISTSQVAYSYSLRSKKWNFSEDTGSVAFSKLR
jgi:hypothetical protein